MKVLCIFDPVGSLIKTTEREFEEFKERFLVYTGLENVAEFELKFNFYNLPSYDVLVVDYGGFNLGADSLIEGYSRQFIKEVENNPNKIFYVISEYTQEAIRELEYDKSIEEFLGKNLFFDFKEFINAVKVKYKDLYKRFNYREFLIKENNKLNFDIYYNGFDINVKGIDKKELGKRIDKYLDIKNCLIKMLLNEIESYYENYFEELEQDGYYKEAYMIPQKNLKDMLNKEFLVIRLVYGRKNYWQYGLRIFIDFKENTYLILGSKERIVFKSSSDRAEKRLKEKLIEKTKEYLEYKGLEEE